MSEDDRIRSKNRVHNEAFNIVSNLKEMGFTPEEMKLNIRAAVNMIGPDHIRDDIYSMALRIIGGLENEESTSS